MTRIPLKDRLVSALTGAFFGALIGLALAWLFVSYPHTTGGDPSLVAWRQWAAGGAVLFGLAGLVFGVSAGSLVGRVIAALFEVVKLDNTRPPWWLLLLLVAAGVAWYLWAG